MNTGKKWKQFFKAFFMNDATKLPLKKEVGKTRPQIHENSDFEYLNLNWSVSL